MDTGRHSSEYRRNRTSLCLQEALSVISKDEDLQGAKLNESLIRRALWAKNYDVQAAIKVLLAYAKWNYKTLGSLSARLSISHVHAFLLTGILQVRVLVQILGNEKPFFIGYVDASLRFICSHVSIP